MPLRCSVLHLIMRRPSAQRLSVVFLKPSLTTDTKTSSLCCVRGRNAVTGAGLPFTDLRCLPIVERRVLLQMQGIVCLVSEPRGVILSHRRVCSSVSSPIWGLWWPWSGRSWCTDVRHRLLGVWAERSNAVPRMGLLFRLLPIVERKVLLQIQGTVCFVSGPRGAMLFHGRVCSSVLHRSEVFADRGAAGLNCCRFYRSEYY